MKPTPCRTRLRGSPSRLRSRPGARRAIERAPAGSVLHGVSEEGVALPDLAEAISRRFGLEPTAISAEEAAVRFGFRAQFVGLDVPASSSIRRELLGWEPTGPTLIEDVESGA